MADLKPPGGGISLDDLLEANRAHFDRILGARMREARDLGRVPAPETETDQPRPQW